MPGQFPGLRGRHAGVEVVREAVRRARQEAGLSQAQLAEPQFTRGAIYQTEAGNMRPSTRLLQQIAQRTGRPVTYFLPSSRITPEHRQAADELHQLVATANFGEAIGRGERLLEDELPRAVEAEVRFLVGRSYVRSLDGRGAFPHLVRARELYELTGEEAPQLADVLNQLACALYLLEDERALSVAYQALDICERLRPSQPELTVRTLIVIGMIFKRLQDWNRAIGIYQRALEEVGTSLGIRNLAMIHDHLSQSLQRVGRFADALHHARKATKFYQGSLDPTDLYRAEQNLGETLLRQGELQAARPHLERALVLCEERALHRQARGATLLALSELDICCGELGVAEARLTEALSVVQQLGERVHEATGHRLRGRIHVERQEYDKADHAFTRAVELFRELRLPHDVFDVQVEYAEALRAQGRIEEALDVAQAALKSGKVVARRDQGGWADVVAAYWGR